MKTTLPTPRTLLLGLLLLALAAAPARSEEPAPAAPFSILGQSVEAGQRKQLSLLVSESLAGFDLTIPVWVLHGMQAGPVLCLTAGVHGDEVNGIEIVRRVAAQTETGDLAGTLVAVPIVNLSAVRRGSRYLPDRRDLNRYFPGRPTGSSASRIAHAFFENVVLHCHALVDVHTGSFHRTNLHQLRADLRDDAVFQLARGLGSAIVVHNVGRQGTLRRAALDAGVPAVTIEAGEPARLSRDEIQRGVDSIERLLSAMRMKTGDPGEPEGQEIYQRSEWVRAAAGGILVSEVELGDEVGAGARLGSITDPITSLEYVLRTDVGGRVIGMAFDQLVMPGFAAIHLGVELAGPGAVSAGSLPDDFGPPAQPGVDDAFDDLGLEERPEE